MTRVDFRPPFMDVWRCDACGQLYEAGDRPPIRVDACYRHAGEPPVIPIVERACSPECAEDLRARDAARRLGAPR